MDWNVTFKNVGILLLVFIVGCIEIAFAKPVDEKNVDSDLRLSTSNANTAEVFRHVKAILSISRPPGGIRKAVKQEAEATGAEGSANALAYLTDSFGGQLAGQILGLILSSITGDVRGILGNSVNLFQNDEQRDRVQTFLDDISKNFLQFTGLGHLTTTRPPHLLNQPGSGTSFPAGGHVGLGIFGGAGASALQAVSGVPASSFTAPATLATGNQNGAFSPTNTNAAGAGTASKVQQQSQQTNAAQQPLIYVLPQLANGGGGSGTQGSKTNTGSKATSSGGDDDSEEDKK